MPGACDLASKAEADLWRPWRAVWACRRLALSLHHRQHRHEPLSHGRCYLAPDWLAGSSPGKA